MKHWQISDRGIVKTNSTHELFSVPLLDQISNHLKHKPWLEKYNNYLNQGKNEKELSLWCQKYYDNDYLDHYKLYTISTKRIVWNYG